MQASVAPQATAKAVAARPVAAAHLPNARICVSATNAARAAAAAAVTAAKSGRGAPVPAATAMAASGQGAPPPAAAPPTRPTLYDVPVSNNGARCRYVIYSQGLDVAIASPAALGGLRSPEFLALSPNGKMPVLRLPAPAGDLPAAAAAAGLAAIYESEVISQYLVSAAFCPPGTLRAADPLAQARADLATRAHDMYVTTAQGCMYKGGLTAEERSAGLAQLSFQLDALERVVAAGGGPFVCGAEVTTADAALAPTFEFMVRILPRHFGWADVFAGRPALRAWWGGLRARDAAMARILDEVAGGLEAWEAAKRWDELGITAQVARGEARYAF